MGRLEVLLPFFSCLAFSVGSSGFVPYSSIPQGKISVGPGESGLSPAEFRTFAEAQLPEAQVVVDGHRLVIKCRSNEPFEHIVWKRFPCPNDYLTTPGEVVAEGASAREPTDYDVRLEGHSGVVTSSLLIRHPVRTGGLFLCQAWADPRRHRFLPNQPATDVFVIGGREMVKACFQRPPSSQNSIEPVRRSISQ